MAQLQHFTGTYKSRRTSAEVQRVSLCSNCRCQSGNISPGWGLCWWDTCTWSHGTALQRGSSAMSSLSSGRRRGPGHCCHSEQTGGTAWRHKLISTAIPWLNGDWPLWCSKISPVISHTKSSAGKTSGTDHAVAALIYNMFSLVAIMLNNEEVRKVILLRLLKLPLYLKVKFQHLWELNIINVFESSKTFNSCKS